MPPRIIVVPSLAPSRAPARAKRVVCAWALAAVAAGTWSCSGGTAEAPQIPSPAIAAPAAGGAVDDRIETSIGLVLRKIAPATFVMGSPPTEVGRREGETLHRVTISKPYWIGETEVTQQQWREVMGTTPWAGMNYTTTGDTVPATFVSWTDAVAFCAKLTERERQAGRLPAGMSYTLPTEAEWELACRGSATNTSAYCFGDDARQLGQYAVFGKPVLGGHADAVRTKQPNAYGLYDMHGNIDEWCADSADFAHGRVVTDTYRDGVVDPLSLVGERRANRGGYWNGEPASCRSAFRNAFAPSFANLCLGFRPVLVARPPVK